MTPAFSEHGPIMLNLGSKADVQGKQNTEYAMWSGKSAELEVRRESRDLVPAPAH